MEKDGDGTSPPGSRKRPRRCKRSFTANDDKTSALAADALEKLQSILACTKSRIIVFAGSGTSATAGIPTFSGSLYQRASRKFQLRDGSQVFHYRFLEANPKECFSFFQSIHRQAVRAKPNPTHAAFQKWAASGRLVRLYTLNIDGLSSTAGMSVGSGNGVVVELHGSVRELVCRACGTVCEAVPESTTTKTTTTASFSVIPPLCPLNDCDGTMRFRVLLYDDQESHLVHPSGDPFTDLLPRDVNQASALLWVGISFRQSASSHHFRRVLQTLEDQGKRGVIPIFIVNPEADEACERLMDALQQQLDRVDDGFYSIKATSDAIFESSAHT